MDSLSANRPVRMAAALIVAGYLSAALGQYPVNQDGRLLDRNPQIGAGGLNAPRPASPLLGGNPFASGTVRGGLSLRVASPIPDPLAFRGSLGSGTLYTFRRDSVSVADRMHPLLGRRVYYDPAITAPTGGFLSGSLAGTTIAAPGADRRLIDAPLPTPVNPYGPIDARIRPAQPGAAFPQPPAPGELSSSLFGAPPLPAAPGIQRPKPWEVQRDELLELIRRRSPLETTRALTPADLSAGPAYLGDQRLDLRADAASPIEQQLAGQQSRGSRLEMLLSGRTSELLERGEAGVRRPTPLPHLDRAALARESGVSSVGAAPGLPGAPEPPGATVDRGRWPTAGPARDLAVLPGAEVFSDMRLALSLRSDPNPTWFEAMREDIRRNPTLSARMQEYGALEAQQFVQRVMNEPLRTFVGAAETQMNELLARAEAAMGQGHYADAARIYEQARLADPLNPLPLIGKAHALLAAGDYLSAAVALVRGLERFPEVARFRVDLAALMGGGEVVDIRRSDIMKRLALGEDPQLRFLLGYIEYHTGHTASGLEHLDKAAADQPPGSIIRRYPGILRGVAPPPPPKLLDDTLELPRPDGKLPAVPPPGESKGRREGSP